VTNAAKYGALSSPKGHVRVEWHQRASGSAPGILVLDWKETAGPPVPASISPGYGISVIKELIPYELGAVVDLVFAPEGVRCRLEIPRKWFNDADQISTTAKNSEMTICRSSPAIRIAHPDELLRLIAFVDPFSTTPGTPQVVYITDQHQ
jgi:hypothetical protein